MHGIAFDWGRYDRTQAHVYSNQAFTRALDNLGIEHTAEEYNGNEYEKNWIEHGRVEERMVAFIGRLLRTQRGSAPERSVSSRKTPERGSSGPP